MSETGPDESGQNADGTDGTAQDAGGKEKKAAKSSEKAKKKPSKGKFILIGLTLAVVIGGGIFAFLYTRSSGEVAEATVEGAKDAYQSAAKGLEEMAKERRNKTINSVIGKFTPAALIKGRLTPLGGCELAYILVSKTRIVRKSPGQKPHVEKLSKMEPDSSSPHKDAKHTVVAISERKKVKKILHIGYFEDNGKSYLAISEKKLLKKGDTGKNPSTLGNYLPCSIAKKTTLKADKG